VHAELQVYMCSGSVHAELQVYTCSGYGYGLCYSR